VVSCFGRVEELGIARDEMEISLYAVEVMRLRGNGHTRTLERPRQYEYDP
jgi:hypothetical protein